MTRIIVLVALSVFLIAGPASLAMKGVSGSATATADPDALAFRRMAAQAERMASREMKPLVLRQVDTDLTQFIFRYTDLEAEIQIDVIVPEPASSTDRWEIRMTSKFSKLLGNPGTRGVDAKEVRIGPYRIANALLDQWPGCTLRSLTLYLEENGLVWVGFCNTPNGVVSGGMNNRTGKFVPSGAPPALPPPTATPSS